MATDPAQAHEYIRNFAAFWTPDVRLAAPGQKKASVDSTDDMAARRTLLYQCCLSLNASRWPL